ncbi:lipopolysaccharide assembly protein LapA domain-containing protein [Williamsia soli]|uniref:lipopolysaccharide assembly protein LapA domain-containing protein n=1 Tax=Williamsia soli TaxID=364929 RepID=UPI001A9E1D05|nr:LapA family protein [Williamsia soli]
MSDSTDRRTGNVPAKGRSLPALSLSRGIALILTILAVVFILQNRDSISVDLFWVSVRSPLWFILIVLFAVGWLAGVLTARGRSKRKAAQTV